VLVELIYGSLAVINNVLVDTYEDSANCVTVHCLTIPDFMGIDTVAISNT
jgi:hypothetical protein